MGKAVNLAQPKIRPNRIRVVLAEKCVTNRWLAEQMGGTDMTVSRWTTNKVQPSMTQFLQMAQILNVKLEALVEPLEDINQS